MPTILKLLFVFFLFAACKNNSETDSYSAITNFKSVHEDGYVGDAQCMQCHKTVYDSWKDSDHDLAMQIANDSTVLGNFNDERIVLDGVSYFFTKKNNKFIAHIKEIDGSEKEYVIAYTFGVYPLQQYLVDFENGRKQVLRVSWDVDAKKWYHQYEGGKMNPHDWMHWTESSQNWNTMCAECHSTNLKKNYSADTDSFTTTYASINVSCESCHGPAEKHVFWAKNSGDTTNIAHTYILKGKTQLEQMTMCAPCHSRRAKLTENLVPGEYFENQYYLQVLDTANYHADGQIDNEDYVYGSFLQSMMYHNNVKCADCHNVHSLKLKKEGNNLCLQCHAPTYNEPSHHFHPMSSESAQCVNCHMTGKKYMGIDFRRDHSFRVPRPDQSVAYGTPNACTQCHTDQTDAWAAAMVKQWYGENRRDHFSDGLLLSTKPGITVAERKKLDAFITNMKYPAIARASVINNLNITNVEQFVPIINSLKDASPLVRYNALMKFRDLNLMDRISIAAEHIADTSRLVRIGSAEILSGVPREQLQNLDQNALLKAQKELAIMLHTNADFATGRLRLGDHYLQNNDIPNAIKQYQMAIKKDSLLLPVYPNLATAYSMTGNTQAALETLNVLLKKNPNYGRAYYLRGLLNLEMKNNAQGEADLIKATALDHTDSRSHYNLATYYYQNKNWTKAEKAVKAALKVEPENGDFRYLLALIYEGQGKRAESAAILQQLQ
ncbi:tetratricopeptide repeat protein [Aequorivita sp. SDUM287046]|uniref:Tetratricopeptide repeat protein n=1 Tax=Aequorivita aurantiaca TaxID=3053356 RepID=A0ABT8DKE2_9FLAO|nr:tetratricopeptide repeat protein [Aequorivita aurantiaca]MDN3725382.1 tetratricopeptide repeat protein [Aequorivita aurantiaca]